MNRYLIKSLKLHFFVAAILFIAGINFLKDDIILKKNEPFEIVLQKDEKLINGYTLSNNDVIEIIEKNNEIKNKKIESEKIAKQIEKELKEINSKTEEVKKSNEVKKNDEIKNPLIKEIKKETKKETKKEEKPKNQIKEEKKIEKKPEPKKKPPKKSDESNKVKKTKNNDVNAEQKLTRNNAAIKNNSNIKNEKTEYITQIRDSIISNWFQDYGESGWSCDIIVIQNRNGMIVDFKYGEKCHYDANFRASVKEAVYSAQPLPITNNEEIFEKKLKFTFNVE